ncbi:MAG: hypothetical protein ACOC4Z_01240 [Patescibacteria group bacterium]
MERNKENTEQPITSKSEQDSKVPFLKNPKLLLYFAIGAAALAVILSLILVVADLTPQDSEPRGETTIADSDNTEEKRYENPRQALDDFLTRLHKGQYEKAAELYSGSTYLEADLKSTIKSEADFLRVYCEVERNEVLGAACMEHKVIGKNEISSGNFSFDVRFFYKGPETEQTTFKLPITFHPPEDKVDESEYESTFEFHVTKMEQGYQVLSLPPPIPRFP